MVPCEDYLVSMIDLPDDSLHIIFHKLESCTDRNAFGLTCWRWLQIQNLARGSLQFKCSHRSSISDNVRYLSRLLGRFQQLNSISLAGCTELPDSALTQLRSSGSNLRTLFLDCCFGITDNGLSLVFAGCPALVSVSLYRCNVTDVGLEILAKSCPTLERVNLSYCTLLSDHGIGALSRECLKLRAMTISYCRGITGTGFRGCSPTLAYLEADSCLLTPDGLLGAVSGGGLQYLNVSSLRCWAGGDGLASIGAGFAKNLCFLNLRLCRFVGNESVGTIAKGCPVLEEWNLALCHEVRVSGWEAIGSNCHNLKVLHVNRCRNLCDHGLRALQDGCHQLAVLYMHGCRRVTWVGLESFRMRRWGVKVRGEENVSVGPSLDQFFL
ncbi:F-box/LRR-repeat protein 12 [Magnolia sinica]|uniref:F-box/LRR-repeat protein 12 n=1 Tax=Magnolia sinica TaxID=86752 RepID=UPI00265AE52D|nr:F-box/LRR-repeat protein 12 [Magnolia sinica]